MPFTLKKSGSPSSTSSDRQLRYKAFVSDGAGPHSRSTAAYLNVTLAPTALIEAPILGEANLDLHAPRYPSPAGYAENRASLSPHLWRHEPAVSDLVAESDRRQERLAAHQAVAADWCLHEGGTTDRMVAFIEGVIADSSGKAR